MKYLSHITKILIVVAVAVNLLGCSSGSKKKGEIKRLGIDQEIERPVTYELGILNMDDQIELTLELENSLQVPVVINDMRGFCGCTLPQYDREPILPGKSANVSIFFLAHQTGAFNKELKMYLSSQKKPVSIIFNGEIVKTK